MDFPYCNSHGTHFSKSLWAHDTNLEKIMLRLLKKCWSDDVKISHKSRELSYCDMLWPGWIFWPVITTKIIFLHFQLWAHNAFVKWVPSNMESRVHLCPQLISGSQQNKSGHFRCQFRSQQSDVTSTIYWCLVRRLPIRPAMLQSLPCVA